MDAIVKCSRGHENEKGANFCKFCSEPLPGGKVKCQRCGYMSDSIAKFCVSCGSAIRDAASSPVEGMVWQRNVDDFATRVETADLPGLLKKNLIVEHGTKALLFINGAYAETLTGGMYDMGGLISKLKKFEPYRSCTAILIDAGDMEFKFTINGVYTKDPLGIDVSCTFVLQVDNPIFFFNNVMKGRDNYPVIDLRQSLYDELHNVMNEIIGKKSVGDLNWDLALKKQFEVAAENHLRTTFQRSGFNLIQFRTIDYRFGRYDEVRGINEETFLMISEEDARLSRRKRLFDVYNENQLQDIFEDTQKTDLYRKRSAVKIDQAKAEAAENIGLKNVGADMEIDEWELAARTRRRMKEHLLDKTKTDEDIEKYLLEIEKGKLLREDEIEVLKRNLNEKNVDHDIRREQMIKKLELEQTLELRRIETIGEADLKMLDLEKELTFEGKRLMGKEGIEKDILLLQLQKNELRLNAELMELEKKAAASRRQHLDDEMQRLKLAREQFTTDADKKKIDLELEKLETDMSLEALTKVKKIKRDDEYERQKMELEKEEKKIDLELKRLKEIHAQELAKIKAQSDAELAKIEVLSKASVEAVISMSGVEQAQIIAGLKETEAMKGMSEEQILAMMSAKSPEVAKAFQEKYKGMSKEEYERLYKMMIEEKDKSKDEMSKLFGEFMARNEREHTQALKTAQEIAIGVSQSGRPMGPQVVYPPQAQPGAYYQPGVGITVPGVVICANCRTQVTPQAGVGFCPNCGRSVV